MRSAWTWILVIAAVHFGLHLWTAGNYGIFRDEYYYLACAKRLAWGYVDQPPLSIAVLAFVREVSGVGVLALRVVPALCGAVIVVMAGRTAAAMGGGGFAQVLAALAMAIVPVVQVISGFYSMNAIDIAVWAAVWLVLALWIEDQDPRWWPMLGVILGLGLLNKIGLLVLGAALGVALLSSRHRQVLRTRGPWIAVGLALLLFSPHIIWQAVHGWPTLEFIENAQRHKITAMPVQVFFAEVILEQHPANFLIWFFGLGWMLFAKGGRRFRMLGLAVVFGFAFLLAQRAKPYYAAGLFPVMIAAGACAWETIAARRRMAWLRPLFIVLLIGDGVFFLPLGIPVLSAERLARWQERTGIAPAAQEVSHTSELPQHYSDRFGWEELAAEVSRIVETLPASERSRVVIFASNYGEAGALEYWSERYTLPPVYSGHNSYWFWLPDELELGASIVVGASEDEIREHFAEVVRAGELEHPWALQNGTPIWIARRPLRSWEETRGSLRSFI